MGVLPVRCGRGSVLLDGRPGGVLVTGFGRQVSFEGPFFIVWVRRDGVFFWGMRCIASEEENASVAVELVRGALERVVTSVGCRGVKVEDGAIYYVPRSVLASELARMARERPGCFVGGGLARLVSCLAGEIGEDIDWLLPVVEL